MCIQRCVVADRKDLPATNNMSAAYMGRFTPTKRRSEQMTGANSMQVRAASSHLTSVVVGHASAWAALVRAPRPSIGFASSITFQHEILYPIQYAFTGGNPEGVLVGIFREWLSVQGQLPPNCNAQAGRRGLHAIIRTRVSYSSCVSSVVRAFKGTDLSRMVEDGDDGSGPLPCLLAEQAVDLGSTWRRLARE